MGPGSEVAHSIALYKCRGIKSLQVGGGRFTRWFITWVRRLTIDRLIREAGFSTFGSHIHCFSSSATDGYTYVMIIGQSSINIHTYPEEGTVSVWVITCPGEDDTGSATKELEKALRLYFGATFWRSEPLGEIPLRRAA